MDFGELLRRDLDRVGPLCCVDQATGGIERDHGDREGTGAYRTERRAQKDGERCQQSDEENRT